MTTTPISASLNFSLPHIGRVDFYQIKLATLQESDEVIYASYKVYDPNKKVITK